MTDKTQEEKVDIRELSVREMREVQKAQRRLTLANYAINHFMILGDPSEEKLEALEAEQDAKLAAFRAGIVKTIRFIPRSWLAENAPEKIAWDNPDDMDWIKNSYVQRVIDIASGVQADEDSKN